MVCLLMTIAHAFQKLRRPLFAACFMLFLIWLTLDPKDGGDASLTH
jgi:hypothetical protein